MFVDTYDTFKYFWKRGEFFPAILGPIFLLLFLMGQASLAGLVFSFFYILPWSWGNPYLAGVMAALPILVALGYCWCKHSAREKYQTCEIIILSSEASREITLRDKPAAIDDSPVLLPIK